MTTQKPYALSLLLFFSRSEIREQQMVHWIHNIFNVDFFLMLLHILTLFSFFLKRKFAGYLIIILHVCSQLLLVLLPTICVNIQVKKKQQKKEQMFMKLNLYKMQLKIFWSFFFLLLTKNIVFLLCFCQMHACFCFFISELGNFKSEFFL